MRHMRLLVLLVLAGTIGAGVAACGKRSALSLPLASIGISIDATSDSRAHERLS